MENLESFNNTNLLLHKNEVKKSAIFLNEETGDIGIEVNGYIIFKPIEEWYKLGKEKNAENI